MRDLLDLVVSIAGRARGSEELEAYATHEREFHVKAYLGEVESVSSAEPRGIGVRVIDEHRQGYAYTTDLTEEGLADVLARVRDNVRHVTPDPAVGLAPVWTRPPADIGGLVDPRQDDVTVEDKVAFVLEVEGATRGFDARIRTVEEAVYADSETEVALATSSGLAASYRRSDAWCYSYAIAQDGDDTQVGFDFDLARGLLGLDASAIAENAATKALEVLGAKKIPSAAMPVVFDRYTAGQFLGVLSSALSGEAVAKGRSLFAGRLGESVAASSLTLVDDGSLAGAPGSAPWDGEGVPTGRTEVIRDGVLSSFLYDLTSARRAGLALSTGNARRAGFKSRPAPGATNLAFDTTGEATEEVLRNAGRALLVRDFHGVHSGTNAVSGDFSVGVTGRLLDGGAPGAPVKEVTIALPMVDILRRIEAVADDRRWLPFGGSLGGATTLVGEMTVAGI